MSWRSAEAQLAIIGNPTTARVTQTSERYRRQRTVSMYARLVAVMERAMVLECCRP
ncbi:hypothetical protein I553_4121 [Mycobacterium xenopi 4042]|uniref:Uncharacterized protein n=1 Tax=Mycobacterium xenopi 4042 TaxID=1299334 RepID=X8AFU4_MYCXE|nr:hypothetical protein I553_4121 [Mycobacterium xenopi 4042]